MGKTGDAIKAVAVAAIAATPAVDLLDGDCRNINVTACPEPAPEQHHEGHDHRLEAAAQGQRIAVESAVSASLPPPFMPQIADVWPWDQMQEDEQAEFATLHTMQRVCRNFVVVTNTVPAQPRQA